MIQITQVEPTPEMLAAYAAISSEFEITYRVDLDALVSGTLVPIPVDLPYVKSPDEDVRDWPRFYDLDGWALFLAVEDGTALGACAVATGETSLYFEVEPYDALLWDIRVSPEQRGRGVGKALLEAAKAWARRQDCLALMIETQDTNFAACKLYRSAGGSVAELRPGAYASYPGETLIVWRLALA